MASPPQLTSLANANRKRPSLPGSDMSYAKRRKPSIASATSTAHPLRQTSFPPPESVVSSRISSGSPPAASPNAGRRGRRKQKLGDGNMAAKAQGSVVSRDQGKFGPDDQADVEEDDEDEDAANDTILEGNGIADEAQLKLERENLQMLIEAFSSDQADRYDMWRRVRLNKGTLVNQTLSQSVPASIVTTVGGYTKLFIGEIIERARDVQAEWTICQDNSGAARMKERANVVSRGPLLPDHLREAVRRYRRDREGCSTGSHGLSLKGNVASASRVKGRRLF